MVCTLTEKEGVANWCERHKMHHNGHYAQYAVDPGEKGERFRRWWNQQSTTKPNWLRHPNLARQCIHLDPHCLTNDEASHLQETAWRLNTNCRSCNGNTNLQKCHGGSGVDGYTTVAWCSAHCQKWKHPDPAYHVDPVVGYPHHGARQFLATMPEHKACGEKIVSLPVINARSEKCNVCTDQKKGACQITGLPLSHIKFTWAASYCPKGEWDADC